MILLGVLAIVASFLPALCLGGVMSEIHHGTLNLCIGNKNGVVVATDSCATKVDAAGNVIGREYNHQKLFQLDENIVVAIAGYNRASVTFAPEFIAPAAGIIMDYLDEIKKRGHRPTYTEAVMSLSHLIRFHLTSVANVKLFSEGRISRGNYIFQMLIVGRDGDKVKITKINLSLEVQLGSQGLPYLSSVVSNTSESVVNNDLTFVTAGYDPIANQILKEPKRYKSKIIERYAHLLEQRKTSEMSVTEMLEMVKAIMDVTGQANPGVAPPIQTAVFAPGRTDMNIPSFPMVERPHLRFNLFIGNSISGMPLERAIKTDSPLLLISCRFERSVVTLTEQYFYFGSKFVKCSILLNSNRFSFIRNNNTVEGTELVLSKNVDMGNPEIQSLISNFRWKNVRRNTN